MLRCSRSLMWHPTIQSLKILKERSFKSAGKFAERLSRLPNPFDNLVLNIRDVHHVLDGVALKLEVTAYEIAENECAPVADMSEVIDGRAATVHPHTIPVDIQRVKLLDRPRKRVK